jgi:Xaa-Pro aminopeptidase
MAAARRGGDPVTGLPAAAHGAGEPGTGAPGLPGAAPPPGGDPPPGPAEPDGIDAAEYGERLERARAAVDGAGLAGLVAFGDCWRAANVGYFTGFRPLDGVSDIANALVVLPAGGGATLVVSEQCLGYAESVTGFPVRPFRELDAVLAPLARRGRARVGLAGAAYVPAGLRDRLAAALGDAALAPTAVLADLKAVKSPAELRLLRRAAALTDLAMATIRDALAGGQPRTERELARMADAAMIAGGADRPAYDSMVQAGPRSAYNLARPTDRVLAPGDLVMTDIGARYRGYVADGGRGFTHGPATAERRAIVEAAAAAVEAGLAAARPGMLAMDLNAVIQRALIDSGYERHSGEARGHGTGHGTGMDPEEESPWIGPGNRTPLVAGMVFTLKATITVPGVGGLRTERIVHLAASGAEPLDRFPMRLHW